jgi:hypothetical protein
MLTPPDDKHSIAAKREQYEAYEALTTPQPTPRDREQAVSILSEWTYVMEPDHTDLVKHIAQALAQREAEVRAEFAAFADEHGKPRKVLEDRTVAGGVMYIHVDPAGTPGEYGMRSTEGKCPKCGKDADFCFGLAYGGYGPYESCSDYEHCDWYWKRILKDDEE